MNVTKSSKLEAAKIAKLEADTEMKRLDIDIKRGKYVLAADVEKQHAEEIARVRAKLLSLPSKLTPAITGLTEAGEVYSRLSSGISEVLNELAEQKE